MNDEQWPGRADHPTEPIEQPGDAPPPGLHSDADSGPGVSADTVGEDWQQRYETQAKRTKIFMATTVAAAAALVGSLFFVAAQAGNSGADPSRFGNPGLGRGTGPGAGPGMGRGPSDGGPPGMGHHGGFDNEADFDDADFDDADFDDAGLDDGSDPDYSG